MSIVWALMAILAVARPVRAQAVPEARQTTEVIQAESDYRFQFDSYRNLYLAYQTTKTEYLRTGSLRAEQEALSAAKALSAARADVLRAYNRWLTLQLLQYTTAFPQVAETVQKLTEQFNWYLDHKTKVQAATTVTALETVMEEYVTGLKERNKLYALAQIDLKLAKLAYFQQQARLLYDPILIILEGKRSIPEVEQGITKVATLGEQINALILEARTKAGAIESGDLEISQAFKQTTTRLETLRSQQLTLITTMMELESRYGK